MKERSELYNLAQQSISNSNRWFGDSHAGTSIVHMVLAMCGEVGEVANIVKKIDRGSLSKDSSSVQYDLAMEMADVFIYFLNICALLHIDPQKIYEQKQAINEKRFTTERKKREIKNKEIVDGIIIKPR